MSTPASLFDYELPCELIAQRSVEPRDHSRLMVVDRTTGVWKHKMFFEIADELVAGDLLVLNDTKVFRARLDGFVRGKQIEVFLLRPCPQNEWKVMIRPCRIVKVGDEITFGEINARVVCKDDIARIAFECDSHRVFEYAQTYGHIPIPPYVGKEPESLEKYQTIYARETGSVAAPTAGFHFTNGLFDTLRSKGVLIKFVTLHVGIGTFRPIRTLTLEEHKMHSEFASIPSCTAQAINAAKKKRHRVIAVGTTTVRTLEGAALLNGGNGDCVLRPDGFSGEINLFISPGFDFKIVDGLITNFHLPKSTLLVLLSAFAGRDRILDCYDEAIRERYRFYSFGDAMFIR